MSPNSYGELKQCGANVEIFISHDEGNEERGMQISLYSKEQPHRVARDEGAGLCGGCRTSEGGKGREASRPSGAPGTETSPLTFGASAAQQLPASNSITHF